ncbi:MAG: hypothetical protein KOO64_09200 [Desulfobacterales bacterium]|nr:hypothetical protein [Desulfobacterales bacterium]
MQYKFFLKKVILGLLLVSIASPVFGQWATSVSKDEMTGEQSSYAHSPSTAATKQMSFPYGDTKAWIGVGCNGKQEWAYVGFTKSPNLSDTTTKDGYNQIRARIKWDDKVESVTLTQDWGASFIHFRNAKAVISKLAGSNTTLLELNWYGIGPTYFRFSLSGSSAALAKIRRECSTD